jgi:hypothetical protein
MIIDCLPSRSRIFHLNMETSPLPVKGYKNLGLCSALGVFEQGGIFIVPHPLWHGASFFFLRSLPKDRLIWSPLTTRKGMQRTYSNPDPHGFPFSRLLRRVRECWTYSYPGPQRWSTWPLDQKSIEGHPCPMGSQYAVWYGDSSWKRQHYTAWKPFCYFIV